MSGLLLGNDHIVIRKNEQSARMLEAYDKRRSGEALHHPRRLSCIWDKERSTCRDRIAFGRRQFFRLEKKAFAQLLIRIAGGIWSGLLSGATLLSDGHGTNRPGSCHSECDYGNAVPHDVSCIPQELRKGSNNSEAIARAAFGDGQTFVCRLGRGR